LFDVLAKKFRFERTFLWVFALPRTWVCI